MSVLLQNWKDVCAGFIGQRLAIYDDLQQGIVRTPTAETQADFDWLVAALLIVRDASTDRWRARAMATVQAAWLENATHKLDTAPARPVTSALRTPSACPQQPRKGQLALFGDTR